jgi:predicted membrane chloride channel (bestrophin family)
MGLTETWKKIWSAPVLKYFPPLSEFSTFCMIVAQCLWTWVVVTYLVEDGEELPFDTSTVFGILTATLGFILPLQLNAALNKNHSCIDNYNAFCGDVLAFAWECVGLTKGDKVLESKSAELQNIFHILVVMPALVKHHFRGTVDMTKATTLADAKLIHSGGSERQQELHRLYTRLISSQENGMCEVEICFMKLLDYIKDFANDNDNPVDPVRRSLLGTWNRVYGSWGNMSNISSYTPPVIFSYVLDVALLLYSIMLPLTIYNQGLNAIWMVAAVSYFFLGLNLTGKRVGNAFVSSEDAAGGFQNVTDSQKTATKAIAQVWSVRKGIASRYHANALDYF